MWKNFKDFFDDIFRHAVGKLTGGLSIVLGVFPVAFPSFFIGDQGILHARWLWWAAAAISFLLAAKAAWSEKKLEVETLKRDLLVAINKDRPEVIAHFSMFSQTPKPDADYDDMIEVQNRGGSDAWAIKIEPLVFRGGRVEFIDIGILGPNNTRPIAHFITDEEGHHKGAIETALKASPRDGGLSSLPLLVSWTDSSGNRFSSSSVVGYDPLDRTAWTDFIGSITVLTDNGRTPE